MVIYALACALSALYSCCYAVHAARRKRFAALSGALLLALFALACGLACLTV